MAVSVIVVGVTVIDRPVGIGTRRDSIENRVVCACLDVEEAHNFVVVALK